MTIRQFLSSRKALKIYLIALGAMLFLLVLDMFIMPWIVHSRGEITIPDVTGKPVNIAWQTLEYGGLSPVLADTVASDRLKPGAVAYQNPVAGSVVREGRNVYLTISGGEEQVQVPNLRGCSLRDARITLEQLDLLLGTVTMSPSTLPVETVVSQSVYTGRTVPKSTRIDIAVSSGPEIAQQPVPNLVSLSLDEAQTRLVEAGLRVGAITYRSSRTLVPNTVISQSPAGGHMVDPQTPIDLVISN